MRNGWLRASFEDAVADASGGNIKTLQSEFHATGQFPIVDQGKELIAGYTDDSSRLCKAPLPVVVFGDHTRCFKFIDFPFCMGADGVKVLRPRIEMSEKYLFHYLKSLELPNSGYDRHYKYLKRCDVVFPPMAEQRRIAAILDQADALRAKRLAALALLDTLTQSTFLEMFGDPVSNPKGWPLYPLKHVLSIPLRNGLSPSNAGRVTAKVLTLSAITGSEFDASAWKTSTFRTTPPAAQSVDELDFLICRGNGNIHLVGKGFFPAGAMADVTFPDTMIAARVSPDRIERAFLQQVWNSNAVRRQIEALARTTNGTFKVNQTMLERVEFYTPPGPMQRTFARSNETVGRLKTAQRASLAKLDELFAALQQRAFRGEL